MQRLGDRLPETLDRLLQDIPTTETISQFKDEMQRLEIFA
jgi:hypothetical protein